MKTKYIIIAFSILSISFWVSCTKGGDQDGFSSDNIYTFSDTASYTQLTPAPAIDTLAAGSVKGWYDQQANNLTFTVAWYGLWKKAVKTEGVTRIDLFVADAAGGNGTLTRSFNITSSSSTGKIVLNLAGNKQLNATEMSDFLAGKWYFVLYTKSWPNGLISGKMSDITRK